MLGDVPTAYDMQHHATKQRIDFFAWQFYGLNRHLVCRATQNAWTNQGHTAQGSAVRINSLQMMMADFQGKRLRTDLGAFARHAEASSCSNDDLLPDSIAVLQSLPAPAAAVAMNFGGSAVAAGTAC